MGIKFRSGTDKDVQINLDSGYSATVTPEWCEIHPMFHRDAIALGCITDNMTAEAIALHHKVGDLNAPMLDRKAKIRDVLHAMILDGDQDDFTQSGHPDLRKVRSRVGFGVERDEMLAVWNEIKEDDDITVPGDSA